MVGRGLTQVIERKNQAEAEFRAAADRLRQANNRYRLRPARASAGRCGSRCIPCSRDGSISVGSWCARPWYPHANFVLAPVRGAGSCCVPKYLSGAMSLGELTQSAAAFVTVQSGLQLARRQLRPHRRLAVVGSIGSLASARARCLRRLMTRSPPWSASTEGDALPRTALREVDPYALAIALGLRGRADLISSAYQRNEAFGVRACVLIVDIDEAEARCRSPSPIRNCRAATRRNSRAHRRPRSSPRASRRYRLAR